MLRNADNNSQQLDKTFKLKEDATSIIVALN